MRVLTCKFASNFLATANIGMLSGKALWSSEAHGLDRYKSADDGALHDAYCDIGCLPTRISNKMPVTTGEARLQLVHTTRAKPTGRQRCQLGGRDACAAAVLDMQCSPAQELFCLSLNAVSDALP